MTDDFDDVDFDADDLGFAPAVSATGADQSSASPARPTGPLRALAFAAPLAPALRRRGGRLHVLRRDGRPLRPVRRAVERHRRRGRSRRRSRQGHQLFATSCVTCHGANLQGVTDRGPSLIGVGSAAAYFQVSTGRMPATGQGAEQTAKPNKFTEAQTEAIAAYVQSVGGGPELPTGSLVGGPDSARRRRAAVPAQLRLVPRLDRQGRAPVGRQDRSEPQRRDRRSRSTPRCCRAPRACRCSTTTS